MQTSAILRVAAERTITTGEGPTPLEIGFTLQGFSVAEGVPRIAAERNQGAHVEVISMTLAIDRNTGVDTVI